MIININNLKNFILQNLTFSNKESIDKIINNLTQILLKYNFDLNNLNVNYGETSINFIKNDIVIRLTYVRYDNFGYDSISEYLSNSSSIEQPIFEQKIDIGEINYPTILVLKKLKVGTVSPNERDLLYIKLREDGYIFNDADKLENFGKDENGNIYLIDFGELIYIKDDKKLKNKDLFIKEQYKKFIERELKFHIQKCKRLNNKYERYIKRKKILNKLKNIKSSLLNLKEISNIENNKKI